MANTGQSDRRKGARRQSNRRKKDIKIIRSEGDKQQEVLVRNEGVSQEKEKSVWGGHEKFTTAWSETFITKKRKRTPRKGG